PGARCPSPLRTCFIEMLGSGLVYKLFYRLLSKYSLLDQVLKCRDDNFIGEGVQYVLTKRVVYFPRTSCKIEGGYPERQNCYESMASRCYVGRWSHLIAITTR